MNIHNSNNESRIFKTYLPAVALFVITVAVMIYFKSSQDSGYNIFDHGGSLLERFYSKNLKPIFQSKDQLSNEDLINFAFNNNLPISDDKVLFISRNPESGREIGIKDAILNKETNNYEKFVTNYCKDDQSRARVDSILDFYRADLSASVLTSENEAIAVDENILKLNVALQTELLECAANSPVLANYNLDKEKIFHLNLERLNEYKTIRAGKEDKKLVFFTPDTVFAKEYNFDKEKIVQALAESEDKNWEDNFNDLIIPVASEVPENIVDVPKIKDYTIGKKKISAIYDSDEIASINLRDSLFKFSIAIKEQISKGKLGSLQFGFESDTESVHFEFNFDELGEFIFQTIEAVGEQSAKNWEQFGLKLDSAASVYEQTVIDSLIKMTIKKSKSEKSKKIRKKIKKSE